MEGHFDTSGVFEISKFDISKLACNLKLTDDSVIFMPQTLKKWGAYWFRLVRSFVLPSVQKKFKLGF